MVGKLSKLFEEVYELGIEKFQLIGDIYAEVYNIPKFEKYSFDDFDILSDSDIILTYDTYTQCGSDCINLRIKPELLDKNEQELELFFSETRFIEEQEANTKKKIEADAKKKKEIEDKKIREEREYEEYLRLNKKYKNKGYDSSN